MNSCLLDSFTLCAVHCLKAKLGPIMALLFLLKTYH